MNAVAPGWVILSAAGPDGATERRNANGLSDRGNLTDRNAGYNAGSGLSSTAYNA